MLRHLRTIILSAALLVGFGAAAVVATPASAASLPQTVAAVPTVDCSGAAASSTVCKTTGQDPIGGRNGILFKVSVILSLVASLGAVIVIIIGGFQYVTAAGDSNKAAEARRTIIAAVIGLVVIAAAQTFIAFILNAVK